MLRDGGYKGGGEVKVARRVAKRVATRALREHENAEHGGKHEALKLKHGGEVKGSAPASRPDRRAMGGETMPHHGGSGKSKGKIGTVNIRVGNAPEALQAEQMGRQQGTAIGAKLASAAPRPPMGPMPGGAPTGAPPPRPPMMPPGGAPGMPSPAMRPPGVMKRGGRVKRAEGGATGDIEHHEGTEFEPPAQPYDLTDGRNADAIPGNLEKPAGKDEYVEPKDETAGRKRGGALSASRDVPGNLEKHDDQSTWEPSAKEQAPRKRGGGCK
jgi:hypothetical protein